MDAYGYCYQNPIKFIDPTGMSAMESDDTYKLDEKGNITKIDNNKYYDSNGVEVDKLIAGNPTYDKDGNLENKSTDVNKGVLDNQKVLSNPKGDKGLSLDFGNSYGNADKTFKFISENTKVEFTFLNFSNPDNISISDNVLFTSHLEDTDTFGGQMALSYARRGQLKEHNHNHPLWSEGKPSEADLRMKTIMIDKTNNFKQNFPKSKVHETKFSIYYRGQYYGY